MIQKSHSIKIGEEIMTNIKAFNIRLPKEMWIFIKKKAIDREMSINQLLIELIKKYQKKFENSVDNDK